MGLSCRRKNVVVFTCFHGGFVWTWGQTPPEIRPSYEWNLDVLNLFQPSQTGSSEFWRQISYIENNIPTDELIFFRGVETSNQSYFPQRFGSLSKALGLASRPMKNNVVQLWHPFRSEHVIGTSNSMMIMDNQTWILYDIWHTYIHIYIYYKMVYQCLYDMS